MPLPVLTMPPALPAFLIEGHGTVLQSAFVDVPMQTGHRRKRRTSTKPPQIVSVSLFLERAQVAEFQAWHRDSLISGERHFAARVKEQGAGMVWYDAVFLSMYQAEALHFGRWRIMAQLLLAGDAEIEPPSTGEFAAEVIVEFSGRGNLTVQKSFAAEIDIEFGASMRFTAEIDIEFEAGEQES